MYPLKIGNRGVRTFFKKDPSKRNQKARTPPDLLQDLQNAFGVFDFDPCPPDPSFDGLSVEWGKNNFVNPPFNALKPWLRKALTEWHKGDKQIIFLMPIRIHTGYFLADINPLIQTNKIALYILERGVQFVGYNTRAPFGMMYLVFPPLSKPQ